MECLEQLARDGVHSLWLDGNSMEINFEIARFHLGDGNELVSRGDGGKFAIKYFKLV